MSRFQRVILALAATLPALWHGAANAQLIITDTLTGASSSYSWLPFNGACLTAGNGSGSIPACVGLHYYSGETLVGGATGRLPDAVGSGALRLTNGDTTTGSNGNNNTGAVISNFTFPSNQGLQVTFTTVTYGGNAYNGTGADGINFFLLDAGTSGATPAPTALGSYGGSLGYTCGNGKGDGIANGYIGLGIDEFGNYANAGDNTSTGIGFSPGTISLRGAGNTTMAWLQANYPTYYPAGTGIAAVQNTCASGYLWNYSGRRITDANGNRIANGAQTTEPLTYNYNWLASSVLPSGTQIWSQQAVNMPVRGSATPITYNLTITNAGLLNLTYSINGGTAIPVMTNQSIVASNGAVPGYYRFGFSAGTGGGSNVHEITCFKAAPVNEAQSSAGTNVQQSAQLQTGSQVYLAYFHPNNWWGQLTAQNLVYNASTNTVSIQSTASWDASCVLTGGACQATAGTNTAETPTSRTMLTWGSTSGIPFEWTNLSSAQQSALTAGDATANSNRLLYLRGDRTNEVSSSGSGTFRVRSGVLGDIVDSSPSWVGAPADPYTGGWSDLLYPSATAPEAGGQSYATYKSSSTAATRQNIVYTGANDGFMHGFRTGAPGSSAPNDGLEVLAYMPSTALSTIHSTTAALDFASPSYSHNFFVDATPATDDLYYNGAWHTWLVGGTGAGGNAGGAVATTTDTAVGNLFALDITDPTQFSETNAASLVLGDWTSSNITCVNNASCKNYLGSQTGTPLIRRLHNGQWGVLFGNGLNSSNGGAGLFIMLVDSGTGARTFRYIDTGTGPSQAPSGSTGKNGIAFVASADLDGDHITDYVYAGDAYGNVWRFDLTSNVAANWSVSSTPLFSTGGLPITSRIAVASVPGIGPQGQAGEVIAFGTGRQFPQTVTSAATYASGTQYLFGVWDWNMSGWNAIAGANNQRASLTAAQFESLTGLSAVAAVTPSSLQAQQILSTIAGSGTISGYRTVSTNQVCWIGSSACSSGNSKFGWKLSLPGTHEQVLYSPKIAYGMFIVNTTIPAASQPLTCGTQPAQGYTMAVAMGSGGASTSSFFADGNNNYANVNGQIVSGIGLGATGSPSIVTANGSPYLIQQTSNGTGSATQVNPAANATGSRVNWIRLR